MSENELVLSAVDLSLDKQNKLVIADKKNMIIPFNAREKIQDKDLDAEKEVAATSDKTDNVIAKEEAKDVRKTLIVTKTEQTKEPQGPINNDIRNIGKDDILTK